MKWSSLFLMILFGFFSPFAFSMTLGEGVAATGLQNTLNSVATPSYSKILNQAKENIKQAEGQENLHKQFKPQASKPNKDQSIGPDYDYIKNSNLEGLSRSELDDRFDDSGVEINADQVDYSKSTAIFYKNNCKNSDRQPSNNCSPIPVLTNIKSVIFNYAHSRGEFKEKAN